MLSSSSSNVSKLFIRHSLVRSFEKKSSQSHYHSERRVFHSIHSLCGCRVVARRRLNVVELSYISTMAATGLTCCISLKTFYVLFISIILIKDLSGDNSGLSSIHRRFEYKYSFKPPYLAQKDGTVPFWEYGGSKYTNVIRKLFNVNETNQMRGKVTVFSIREWLLCQ